MKDVRILLDNIRSVHNVGSIFRTAETLAVSKMYCAETTPTPTDRFNHKRKDFAKVSLGTEDLVEWEHVENPLKLLNDLKKQGFQIISIEQDTSSVDYREVKIKDKALIILGNEVDGVSGSLLKKSDIIAEIPLNGKKESLNVSVSAGIALYRMLEN